MGREEGGAAALRFGDAIEQPPDAVAFGVAVLGDDEEVDVRFFPPELSAGARAVELDGAEPRSKLALELAHEALDDPAFDLRERCLGKRRHASDCSREYRRIRGAARRP